MELGFWELVGGGMAETEEGEVSEMASRITW